MKRKIVYRKKCSFYFLLISIFLFTIGLFAFIASNEFQVNTYAGWIKDRPAIAMDEEGNFVITWVTWEFYSQSEVFARRFNSKGKAIATEFKVNTYINYWQDSPAIAMHKKGNFVITWQSYPQDGSGYGVFAKRFNSKGKARGREFQVNTYNEGDQGYPAIAMDEKGNFVITWESWQQDGSHWGVYAQRFNSKGKAIGREFQVNTYNEGDQQYPAIAMDEKGNFVITWESWLQDGSDWGVYAQRYNSKGEAMGTEFQVNTYMKWYQWHPAIAMARKGNFVITWGSEGEDGSSYGVYAQRFKKNGEAVGSEFQINTYTQKSQDYPAVAMDNGGNFVISWESQRQDGSGTGIFAQMYNRKGVAVGNEFQVNTYIRNMQALPAIAMKKKNKYIVTWISDHQDGSGVFARMFLKWAK